MPTATIHVTYGVREIITYTFTRKFRTWKGGTYGTLAKIGRCRICHSTFWWWECGPTIHPQTGALQDYEGSVVCDCQPWRDKFDEIKEQWKPLRRFFK